MYKIVKTLDGKYNSSCMYQDGTDRWTDDKKDDAIKNMISAAKCWNHAIITEADIQFGEEVQVVKTEIRWEPKTKKCCDCKC